MGHNDTTPLTGLPEAIPLKVLYGNADKRMPRISPDGKYYAYLADADNGVTNIFVKPVQFDTSGEHATLVDADAQQVTNEQKRPLRFFMWTKSLTYRRILYIQDTDGDENFHLHVVDFTLDAAHKADNVSVRDLTPYGPVTVMPGAITLSHKFPDEAIISLNKRDERFFDACKLHLVTGALETVLENPGDVGEWLVDDTFNVVGANAMRPEDGSELLRVPRDADDKATAEWKTIATWPHGEISRFHQVSKDGKAAYYETSLSHTGESNVEATNTSRLVLLSLVDGKEIDVIAQDQLCDVGSVSFNEATHTVDYVVFNYTKPRVQVIDESLRGDMEHLLAQCHGEFSLVSTSEDYQTWMYADGPDDASLKYYIYDRATRRNALLFDSRPDLSQYTLVQMDARVIQTSDNEDMIVYMSLPHGIKTEKLPFVLNVHGGPWARDEWGFNPTHQFFTNRGYGCLSVNFRGSTGLGKRWTNLGDKQWGATMQQDLTDAVQWAIKEGFADPERVAIYGGSYGGYATLAGLAFTPELYVCGVDIVGPSNAKTLFESIPPYWATMKQMLVLRVGDVENDEALNRKISPLYHAEKMVKPLLIAQGANDPRVKKAESDQIAKKLYENKQDVKYVLYTDEGHGFARPVNRLDFFARTEEFLATYLGGRVLPKDEALVAGNTAVEIDPAAL